MSTADGDLAATLAFFLEIDQLKGVERQNHLADGSRRENTAEHSWHLGMAVALLAPFAAEPVDLAEAITMALVHDLVEIDAGDTFAYDEGEAAATKDAREAAAADRLYGMLPAAAGERLRELWESYERGDTPEARLVMAVDRLAPVLLNLDRGRHDVARARDHRTTGSSPATASTSSRSSRRRGPRSLARLDAAVAAGRLPLLTRSVAWRDDSGCHHGAFTRVHPPAGPSLTCARYRRGHDDRRTPRRREPTRTGLVALEAGAQLPRSRRLPDQRRPGHRAGGRCTAPTACTAWPAPTSTSSARSGCAPSSTCAARTRSASTARSRSTTTPSSTTTCPCST